MQSSKGRRATPVLRLVAFFLLFAVFIVFADVFLIQTDLASALMIREMHSRNDLDLVFVGSSIVRDHFNHDIISEMTGHTSFSASVPCLAMQGSIALTKELFLTNHPSTIVLVVEPYTFETEREGIEAEDTMMPWLTQWDVKLEYYKNLVRADGWYMDRILLFRDFGVQSLSDILKTAQMRLFPDTVASPRHMENGALATYEGRGFVRYTTDVRADDAVREKLHRQVTGYTYELLPQSRELLLQYRDLVEGAGCNLLVFIYPNMTAHNLAEPAFLGYNESVMKFCEENSIASVNFALAKPELMPNLDDRYFDIYHLDGVGADIFSRCFASFYVRYEAGEDLSSLFYTDNSEYLDSLTLVTNTWLTKYKGKWDRAFEQKKKRVQALYETKDVYLANSNHGPRTTVEYRFFSVDGEGRETALTDWETTGIFTLDTGDVSPGALKVYARPQNDPEAPLRYDVLSL